MYKIVIANQCSCFKQSTIKNHQKFDSKQEALEKALELTNFMNEHFCKKHQFEVQEIFNNFMIKFYEEEKAFCCGNACGDACTRV